MTAPQVDTHTCNQNGECSVYTLADSLQPAARNENACAEEWGNYKLKLNEIRSSYVHVHCDGVFAFGWGVCVH